MTSVLVDLRLKVINVKCLHVYLLLSIAVVLLLGLLHLVAPALKRNGDWRVCARARVCVCVWWGKKPVEQVERRGWVGFVVTVISRRMRAATCFLMNVYLRFNQPLKFVVL